MDPAETQIIEGDIALDIAVRLERQDSLRMFRRTPAPMAQKLPDDAAAHEAT